MKKNLLLISLITSHILSITYKVVDEQQNPIPYVQIYNSFEGAVSDENGLFSLNDKCIPYEVSHIGFQKVIFNPCDMQETIILKNLSVPNPEIEVLGDIGKSKLKDVLSNVEIFTKTNIINSGKTSFEDILKASTNVNYSGVSSRPRYFQIRGIGEYEQYVSQAGPSYYVATYINNFNYSGLGIPVSLFDVNNVEVFKGGQSFIFGQNALGGIIKVNLNKPKPLNETNVMIETGSFNKNNIHFTHNRPLVKNINLRLSVSRNSDKGFIYNTYLKDYSNKRDELISNLQLSWNKKFNSEKSINLILSSMNIDLNNNYDRWSYSNFDNMQDFVTHSNFAELPNGESKDALKGISNGLELNFINKDDLKITSILSFNNVNLNHYYDADWSNEIQWYQDHPSTDFYDFAQQEKRNRNDKSLELKLSKKIKSSELIIGAFSKSLLEKDNATGFTFYTEPNGVYDFNEESGWGEIFTDIGDGTWSQYENFEDSNSNESYDDGENFEDSNNNGMWDGDEIFIDCDENSLCSNDEGWDLETMGNGVWDEGEDFIDIGNGVWDQGEDFIDSGGYISKFESNYSIDYLSFYYQHKYNINKKSYISFNLRNDNYKNNYSNYLERTNSTAFNISDTPSEFLPYEQNFTSYRIGIKLDNFRLSLSTGYKPGGYNQNPYLSDDYRKYLAEKSTAIEFSYKQNFKSFIFDLNIFHINRKNIQIDIADQADPSNPVTFYFYTANVNKGLNSGIDMLINYQISRKSTFFLNCGLLKTNKDAFSYPSPIYGNVTVKQREQARSPKYTISTGVEFQATSKLYTRLEVLAKDKYYYFNNTNQMSKSYMIVNLNSKYKITDNLDISLSLKNATDERYGIHGFYFSVSGYEPRKFHESPANPRDISVSLSLRL